MLSNLTSAVSGCAIGLDVGGTKIAGGLVNFPAGWIVARQTIPTQPWRGGEVVLAQTLNLADSLLAEAERLELVVGGIGLAVCELVDLDGNITSGHAVAWSGLPIQEALARLAPAAVESDVRAAALAEAMFGAGQPYRLFVYVTVGTGISSCLVQAGRPYPGAHGNALILASSPLTSRCPSCGARLTPILEDFAGGPALVTRYNHYIKAHSRPGLQPGEPLRSGEEVLAAVEANDPAAIEVVKSAGEALGVSVGWLVNVLDPEAVVVGGGLGLAGGLYWDSFVEATRAHIWARSSREIPILPASLGPEAGVIGAAATAALKVGLLQAKEVV